MKKLNKKQKNKILQFIKDYQMRLWSSDKNGLIELKEPMIINIITKTDLLYFLEIDMTLKEFNEFLEQDEHLKNKLNDFINNNYIHYASSVKLKDLLQDYKDSNVQFENNIFKVDYSQIQTLNQFSIRSQKESLAMGYESDVDDETRDKILETVEKYN